MKEKKFDDIQELSLEQIEEVVGGKKIQPTRIACQHCERNFYANIMKSKVKCPYCREDNVFAG